MKKLLCIILATCMMLSASSIIYADEIKVLINGEAVSFDVAPQTVEDRTLVPLRKIFEVLGADVQWNEEEQIVSASIGNTVIELKIGSAVMNKNGELIPLDVAPQVINDRTMIPARAVAEGLGCSVDWDEESQSVIITMSGFDKNGIDFGDDAELKLLHSQVRYYFEQSCLPGAMEYFSADILSELKNGVTDNLKKYISGLWNEIVIPGMLTENDVSVLQKLGISDEEIYGKALEQQSIKKLDPATVFEITDETLENGNPIVIVSMADIGETPLCSYIGITYDDEGIRYFTLEQSEDDDAYTLCRITTLAHGTYFPVANDKNEFVSAISKIIENGIQPSTETKISE